MPTIIGNRSLFVKSKYCSLWSLKWLPEWGRCLDSTEIVAVNCIRLVHTVGGETAPMNHIRPNEAALDRFPYF